MARTKQPKSTLTLGKINKEDKQYNQMELFEFSNGETVKFHVTFRPSTIEDLFYEFQQLQSELAESDQEISDKLTIHLINVLIIKYFTDLRKDFKDETAVQKIARANAIIDSIYYKEMMEEMFLKEEIHKVYDKATDIVSSFLFMDKLNGMVQKKVETLDLQSRDILFPNTKVENTDVQ